MPETLWAAVETVPDTKKQASCHCYVKIDALNLVHCCLAGRVVELCVLCTAQKCFQKCFKRVPRGRVQTLLAKGNRNLSAALSKGKGSGSEGQ